MKTLKKILLGVLIMALLLITAAVALPFIFKDKIIDYAVDRANEELTAEIQYSGVDLSVLRSFPRVSLGLKDFKLISKDSSAKFDTISRIDDLYFSINISDLWKDPEQIEIKGFELSGGLLNLYVDEQGKANYLIYQDPSIDSSDQQASGEELKNISLDNYIISGVDIRYIDVGQEFSFEVNNLIHSGTGQFDAVKYEFDTETSWEDLQFTYANTPYISGLNGESRLKLLANTETRRYELLDNFLRLNELNIESKGFIVLNEYPDIELQFASTETNFGQVLSLIPAIYSNQFKNLDTRGEFTLQGSVNGQIGPDQRVPAFDLIADIKDGYFKYSGLSESVSDVSAHMEVRQNGQLLDQTKVDITDLKLSLGGDRSSGELFLSQLLSNPAFRGQLKGNFKPSKISQMIYLEDLVVDGERFSYDLAFNGNQNSILREAYQDIEFSGEASILNSSVAYANYPSVKIRRLEAKLNPTEIQLQNLDITGGKSDFKGNLTILNPLAYFDENAKPLLSGTLQSEQLFADEWIPEATDDESKSYKEDLISTPDANGLVPVDLNLNYKVGNIEAMGYKLSEVDSRASFANDQLTIKNLKGLYDGAPFNMTGQFSQVMNYVLNDGTLMGSVRGDLGTLDLTPFLESNEVETEQEKAQAETYDVSLPEKINLSMDLNADKLILSSNELLNATMQAQLSDRKIIISEARGNSFGGSLGLRGIFETPEGEKPRMDFQYDMSGILYKQIFDALESFQQLAPLAEYINGKFNLDLEFSGLMNEDLSIDLNSIQANGFVNTVNAYIENFPAINTLSNKFDLGGLEDGYQLKNTKNWLQIRDGKVYVEEFERKLGGLNYRIKGTHSIDQNINYQVQTSIPKARLKGTGIDKGMDLLVNQANKLGLNLDQAEYIDVQFNLSGRFSEPKLDFKVLGVSSGKGSGNAKLQDQAKEQVKEELEKEKQKAIDRLKEEKQRKEEELQNKIDEEKRRLEEEKKKREEELRKKLEEEKKRKEEELRKKAEEEKEKLKKKLKDLNPFKDGG
ncbi:MAG TPA: AsmA-like C-terminal region-containing protein [Saprospiraceae bacterium]|nr:AsmA-like C-terminal region-containing protein [Saprospiraceae bacterium]